MRSLSWLNLMILWQCLLVVLLVHSSIATVLVAISYCRIGNPSEQRQNKQPCTPPAPAPPKKMKAKACTLQASCLKKDPWYSLTIFMELNKPRQHVVVFQNTCPQNGHNVGSLLGSPFKEVYSQWSLLYKDL